MLKEEIFDQVAKEYGTSIGVAKIFSLQPLEEVKDEFETKAYKEYEKGLTINYIITDSIYEGIYEKLQKKIYELKVVRKTKIQDELKLYKKAYKEITNNEY
jgi:hypothetical protein